MIFKIEKTNKRVFELIKGIAKGVAKEGSPAHKNLYIEPETGTITTLDGKRLMSMSGIRELTRNNIEPFVAEISIAKSKLFLSPLEGEHKFPDYKRMFVDDNFSQENIKADKSIYEDFSAFTYIVQKTAGEMATNLIQNGAPQYFFMNLEYLKDVFNIVKTFQTCRISAKSTNYPIQFECISDAQTFKAVVMPMFYIK